MWSCESPILDIDSSQVSGSAQDLKRNTQSNTTLEIADNKQCQCPPLVGWKKSSSGVSRRMSQKCALVAQKQTELCAVTCLKELGGR